MQRPDSAMVLGHTAKGDLLMLRGRRDTTGEQDLLELPCGGIELGERPEDAAIRETLEESGYRASNLRHIGSLVESPGISSATCHVFHADVVLERDPALEDGEAWEPELVRADEVQSHIRAGVIRDGGTLAAFTLLATRRP